MADEADIASEHEAATLAAQIAAARVRRNTGLIPSGACHYCDTPVGPSQSYFATANARMNGRWSRGGWRGVSNRSASRP